MNEVSKLLNKINGIENLVIVNSLEVSGNLPAGNEVTVKCTGFRFDSGVHNCPINFSVYIHVDGVCAMRWDMCFDKEQKEFQQGWVRLIAQLQSEQFKREDIVRDKAVKLWSDFS